MVNSTMNISRRSCSSYVTAITMVLVLGLVTITNGLMVGHRFTSIKPKHVRQLSSQSHHQRCNIRSISSCRITTSTVTMCSPFAPYFNLKRPFSGLVTDFRRRAPLYRQDWLDGFKNKKKVLGAICFLYFACLAPTVAFGGLTSIITEGSMGVIEFITSCGIGGMVYALISGQPMTFLGPTGLTLAFTAALYNFTQAAGLPFLPMYSWIGLWTSLFLALGSIFNLSYFIRFCTRFTDDCFNSLIAMNFLFEAIRSVARNFTRPAFGMDLASSFAAMNLALATWVCTTYVTQFKRTKIGNPTFRNVVSKFGPSMVIVLMSALAAHPVVRSHVFIEKLSVPATFALANGRALVPDLLSISPMLRLAASLPAVLLTMLFYLDQNISVRAVNACRLKKGEAYHQDLLALALVVAGVTPQVFSPLPMLHLLTYYYYALGLSFCGLPWVCGATVQSLNHVRALGEIETMPSGAETIDNITETRLTGLVIHGAILGSLLLLPLLAHIPVPVISGIFLYLGRKMMTGNLFLDRVGQAVVEERQLPMTNAFRLLPRLTVFKYLFIQIMMVSAIWFLKQSRSLALFFPSCIAFLVFTRAYVLPRLFSNNELGVLDPDM